MEFIRSIANYINRMSLVLRILDKEIICMRLNHSITVRGIISTCQHPRSRLCRNSSKEAVYYFDLDVNDASSSGEAVNGHSW